MRDAQQEEWDLLHVFRKFSAIQLTLSPGPLFDTPLFDFLYLLAMKFLVIFDQRLWVIKRRALDLLSWNRLLTVTLLCHGLLWSRHGHGHVVFILATVLYTSSRSRSRSRGIYSWESPLPALEKEIFTVLAHFLKAHVRDIHDVQWLSKRRLKYNHELMTRWVPGQ